MGEDSVFRCPGHLFYLKASVTGQVWCQVIFDVRYYFLKGKHTPYIAAQAGATMYAYYKVFGGGAMLGLQLGGRFTIARRVGMLIFAGYRMQHIAVNADLDYVDHSISRRYTASGLIQTVFSFFHVGGGFSF